MTKNTSVILGDHFNKFIKNEVKSGRYASASEVLRSGLRLLEVEKAKIEFINNALEEGEESGSSKTFDNEKFKQKMREKYNINA